ncbi:MAG: ABC transporter permease [Planctomycetota bacterium]
MNPFSTLRIAFRALMRNKARSLLTTLGIIVGIASLIAVVAVGQGSTVMIRDQIAGMGNNLIIIFPGSMKTGGFHAAAGSQVTLSNDDAEAILAECPDAVAVSPVVMSGGQLIYRDRNCSTSIQGVSAGYPDVRNWEIAGGSFFDESNVRSAVRVAVIGATVAKELFDGDDPLGKTIRIRNMPFQVIGVLAKKGSAAWGQDQDDIVLAPWTTVKRVLRKSPFNDVNQILVSLNSLESLEPARQEIAAILRQRHRIAPGAEDDFTVTDMTEVTKMITQVSTIMTVLLTVIASISLIVGGIGIMNIMLVSVTERTREIGIRKAIGAKRRDILLQFLIEAAALSLTGGLIGLALALGGASLMGNVPFLGPPGTTIHPQISISIVIIALAVSVGTGLVSGTYPAFRAARLDPIESLRHE